MCEQQENNKECVLLEECEQQLPEHTQGPVERRGVNARVPTLSRAPVSAGGSIVQHGASHWHHKIVLCHSHHKN